jgi:leucyl aminopeptidase
MSVDPADDCTFWFTGMYNPASQWRTRIATFKFDSCGNAIPANTAIFNPGLQAPSCLPTGRSCDSAALLNGRDTIAGGNEPNQPNTIADSCADGTQGAYHLRESIDRLRVATVDATQMSPGKTVRVEAFVWNGGQPTLGNRAVLDLFRADDANAPVWTRFASIPAPQRGANTLSATFVLTAGPLQAVRARFGYRGGGSACATGLYDDHDDLVFTVQ